jgi:hypothetical protein
MMRDATKFVFECILNLSFYHKGNQQSLQGIRDVKRYPITFVLLQPNGSFYIIKMWSKKPAEFLNDGYLSFSEFWNEIKVSFQ